MGRNDCGRVRRKLLAETAALHYTIIRAAQKAFLVKQEYFKT